MRVTIASAANDHRLGANEAPPAIISVYLGDAMDRLVTNVEHGKFVLDVEVPNIQASTTIRANADLTDRNRTTPFAFTGNKFEFRAVGSTENPAWPMTVLNTAVADSAKQLRARLEGKLSHGGERIAAVRELVSEVFRETRSIRYEGNNYAKEWVIEAERRGLPVLRNTPAALARLLQKEPTQFLVEQRVFTPDEIASRYDVYAEKYIKTIEIEAVTLGEMASTQVLPLVDGEIGGLAGARSVLESLHLSSPRLQDRVRRLSQLGDELHDAVGRMMKARERVHGQDTLAASMGVVASELLPMMQAVRQAIDALEGVVDDAHWPFAKYREMLFLGV
jgi:glutamine synthetase